MCVNAVGIEYILKNVSESRITKEMIITFTCVKEDFVVYNFLLCYNLYCKGR